MAPRLLRHDPPSTPLVIGAFRYEVYVDTESLSQRIVAHDIEATSFSLSGLEPLTTYYRRVVAKGDPF